MQRKTSISSSIRGYLSPFQALSKWHGCKKIRLLRTGETEEDLVWDRYVTRLQSPSLFFLHRRYNCIVYKCVPLFYYPISWLEQARSVFFFCLPDLYIYYVDFRLSLRIVHFCSFDLCYNNTSFHEVPQVCATSYLNVFVWTMNVQQDTTVLWGIRDSAVLSESARLPPGNREQGESPHGPLPRTPFHPPPRPGDQ